MPDTQICPHCGTENQTGFKYCTACGKPMQPPAAPAEGLAPGLTTIYCPNCHAPNSAETRYCHNCRYDLQSQSLVDKAAGVLKKLDTATSPIGKPNYITTNRMDKLGSRLDGWAEVVIAAGNQAETVKQTLHEELTERGFPEVQVATEQLKPDLWSSKRRDYHLFRQQAGATQTFYVGAFGKDLYISWDVYYKPMPNWRNIRRMLGAAVILGAITSCGISWAAFRLFVRLGGDLDVLFPAVFGWCLGLFTWTVGYAFNIFLLAAIIGFIIKRNFLHFFFIEIDAFTADDIAAMILSGHKALQRAVDRVGLDVTALRNKINFVGGRSGRLI